MQCQLCNKISTVHLTEINNGQKSERHLCQQCAQKEGIAINTQQPISEMLTNLVAAKQESEKICDIRCPQCDLSWADFRRRGLLGCANDYLAFGEPLMRLIEQAQSTSSNHIGRIPKNTNSNIAQQIKLLRLRQDLQHAVEKEDYEVAVKIRDEIKKINPN